jgi:dTDP-4-dehydrorhamnose 3,5-epimerase
MGNIEQINEKVISVSGGDVLHVIKHDSRGFISFGEAYFSNIDKGFIKAWKLHKEMHLNLIVPIGEVSFVFFDINKKFITTHVIGENNYARLHIPPKIWFGFRGEHDRNLILNVASIKHNANESNKLNLNEIDFEWSKI